MAPEYKLEPFKEPRGFLKILQWLFAICAFATTVNFSTDFQFEVTVKCNVTSPPNGTITAKDNLVVKHVVQYPFALDQMSESQNYDLSTLPNCKNVTEKTILNVGFISNVKSDAEFFVTTGVLCFLYATALIAVYLFADERYSQNTNAPVIDFVFTLIFAVFWLSGSAAWSNGLSMLKNGANPAEWKGELSLFDRLELVELPIRPIKAGVFGGLVISILFGFINFILWAANLWFLYKETTWFESIMKNTQNPSTSAATG